MNRSSTGRKSSLRRRRTLLWAAALFALLQAGLDLLIDGRWPQTRSAHLARVLNEARSRSPDVVCLGTSRFGMGLLADAVLEPELRRGTGDEALQVFNAAMPCADFITSDYVLERMLRKGARPSVVVIEVCPEMLNSRNRICGNYVLPPLAGAGPVDYAADVWRSGNLAQLARERAFPIYRCRRGLWNEAPQALADDLRPLLPGANVAPAPRGPRFAPRRPDRPAAPDAGAGPARPPAVPPEALFLTADAGADARAVTEAGLTHMRQWLGDYRVGGAAPRALDRLLLRCRRHDIRAFLVAPPVASCQRRLYTPDIEAAFRAYLAPREAACGYALLDYRDRMADELFSDNVHLKAPGGVAFSRLLAREILLPAFRAR